MIGAHMRYCRVSATHAAGCASSSRSNKLSAIPGSASSARTTGGSCLLSPTKTKRSASIKQDQMAESNTWDASSTMTRSKRWLLSKTSPNVPMHVEATTGADKNASIAWADSKTFGARQEVDAVNASRASLQP